MNLLWSLFLSINAYYNCIFVILYFQERYRNHERRLPLNEGYQYYPRFFPNWQWDQGNVGMAGNGEGGQMYGLGDDGKRFESTGYAANVYDNPSYLGYRSSRSGGSYKLQGGMIYLKVKQFKKWKTMHVFGFCHIVYDVCRLWMSQHVDDIT